jgi:hypothetical protein
MSKANHKWYGWWCSLRNQYSNPNNHNYHLYGGRGLSMSPQWMKSFERFCEDVEALGPKPHPMAVLERKNKDLGHSKSNCRWATRIENSNNRRTNYDVKFKGKTQSLADWARELGFTHRCLWSRLHDHGYTIREAFTTPLFAGNKRKIIK